MSYPSYKKARDAAWNFLIENEICELPMRFGDICKTNEIGLFRDCTSSYFKNAEQGITYIRDGRFAIVVNGADRFEIQRFTIAHELGHIYMHHPMTDDLYGRNFGSHYHPNFPFEYQAERFAMGLLAPACVLWGLGIKCTKDIAKICNIAREDAAYRANRISMLYKRDKFLLSPLEKKVYEQFEDYILRKKKEIQETNGQIL